jgi:hypothetical protein
MEDGLRFAIREGGRTVGAGVVAKINKSKAISNLLCSKGPLYPGLVVAL